MATKSDLHSFVRDALAAGQTHPQIAKALDGAGWSKRDVSNALSSWAELPFAVPVPRPRPLLSARDFLVYAMTFTALIASACYLYTLLHHLIDVYIAKEEFSPWRLRSIRQSMAGVVVSVPIYGWLTWREEKRDAENPGQPRSAIRNWLTHIALYVTAATFLQNLIGVLAWFFSGRIELATALDAAVIGVISGAIFLLYLNDVRKLPV